MLILKKGHQPGVYVPLRALFLVQFVFLLKYMRIILRHQACFLVGFLFLSDAKIL